MFHIIWAIGVLFVVTTRTKCYNGVVMGLVADDDDVCQRVLLLNCLSGGIKGLIINNYDGMKEGMIG